MDKKDKNNLNENIIMLGGQQMKIKCPKCQKCGYQMVEKDIGECYLHNEMNGMPIRESKSDDCCQKCYCYKCDSYC